MIINVYADWDSELHNEEEFNEFRPIIINTIERFIANNVVPIIGDVIKVRVERLRNSEGSLYEETQYYKIVARDLSYADKELSFYFQMQIQNNFT
jgi:hypothetical protein